MKRVPLHLGRFFPYHGFPLLCEAAALLTKLWFPNVPFQLTSTLDTSGRPTPALELQIPDATIQVTSLLAASISLDLLASVPFHSSVTCLNYVPASRSSRSISEISSSKGSMLWKVVTSLSLGAPILQCCFLSAMSNSRLLFLFHQLNDFLQFTASSSVRLRICRPCCVSHFHAARFDHCEPAVHLSRAYSEGNMLLASSSGSFKKCSSSLIPTWIFHCSPRISPFWR